MEDEGVKVPEQNERLPPGLWPPHNEYNTQQLHLLLAQLVGPQHMNPQALRTGAQTFVGNHNLILMYSYIQVRNLH